MLTPKLLPYSTMLLTLASAWPEVLDASGPEVGARRERLIRWFWTTTLLQRYESQANSRTQADVPALRAWLRGEGREPEGLTGTFDRAQFRSITYRQQALYRASLALSLRHQPRDFHEGKPLTSQRIAEEQVDDHHIFPRNYLKEEVSAVQVDCVLNRTLIDRLTNMRISDKAPSTYLAEMKAALSADLLVKILNSHGLPADEAGPLFQDRFHEFLQAREERLGKDLEAVTGWML